MFRLTTVRAQLVSWRVGSRDLVMLYSLVSIGLCERLLAMLWRCVSMCPMPLLRTVRCCLKVRVVTVLVAECLTLGKVSRVLKLLGRLLVRSLV